MIEDSQMEVVSAATSSITAIAEEEEEIRRKKYLSLPSNYVSLAQLRERWLQQQQKQEQEKKEHQQGKTTTTTSSQNQQRPEKPKKEESDGQRGKNGERRIEGKKAIYVPRRRLLEDGSRRGGIGGEDGELKLGASFGVERADSRVMDYKIKGKQKKYYDRGGKSKKRMMAGSLIGREDENMRNSGGENGGWKDEGSNWGELQGNDTTGNDRRVEENLGVCPLEAVDEENRGKEVNFVSIGGEKRIDHEGFGGGVWRRNGDDDLGLGGSISGSMVEMLTKNDEHKEEVPVHLPNADDQALGIAQVANACIVEVLPENVVQEGVSAGNGRKYGQGRLRGRYRRNVPNNRKGRVSEEDGKVQLGQGRDKEVKEKALIGKSEWSGGDQIQKGGTRTGIQEAYAYKERLSDNLGPNIRRDFKALSLSDSKEGNVTSTKWLRGGRSGRQRNSRDGGLVWMPKGETSGNLCSSNATT